MFIILHLTQVALSQKLTTLFGYDASGNICPMGFADCQPTQYIPCEFGYFLYIDPLNQHNCLPCPYFLFQDNLNILCGDCLEDPYNWQKSRTCTYNYRIQTGSADEVYVRENVQKTIFYIQEKATSIVNPTRPVKFKYELLICEGCRQFCILEANTDNNNVGDEQYDENQKDEVDEGDEVDEVDERDEGQSCFDNNQQDNQYNGITCLDHYYYIDFECRECQKNCKSCNSKKCKSCIDGYYLDRQSFCQMCQPSCQKCEYSSFDNILLCLQCSRSDEEYLVESPDFQNCQTCEYQCARCEYISYDYYKDEEDGYLEYGTRDQYFDPNINYILRCRQCVSSSQFISYDGQTCEICSIQNCQLCYYELNKGTTLDYDFIPADTPKNSDVLCHLCKEGYYRKDNKKECLEIPSDPDTTCSSYNEFTQTKCTFCNEYPLDLQSIDNPTCLMIKKCSNFIKNCDKCFFQKQPENQDAIMSICTQCRNGYYPDIFSGKCLNCPINCKTCWQYTPSYNFTSYLQTYQKITQEDISNFILEQLQDAKCTQCQEGYFLYNNQCIGCTSNCKYCYYDDEKAFCYYCGSPDQQSIVSDMSECQECPRFCAACRDREDTDPIVNRYFNPVNQILNKYSRLCYKLDSKAMQTQNYCVFLDNQIGLPVSCQHPDCPQNKQYKCFKTEELNIDFHCDEDLDQKYNSAKSKTSIITFQEHDSFAKYQNYNENTIKQLIIKLNFIGNICQFKKESQFKFSFLQNVYSLQKVKLKINQDLNSLQKWIATGIISFVGVSEVQINNVQIQYHHFDNKNSPKEFGFLIKNQEETQFSLQNVEFIKDKFSNQKLIISVDNPINFTMQNVKIQNIERKDQVVSFNYTLRSLSYQDFKIISVQLVDCDYNYSTILAFSNLAPSLFLKISNLKITGAYFTSSSIIRSIFQTNSLFYQIDKLTLIFNYFSNSTLFQLANLRTSEQFSNIDILHNRFINSKAFLMNSFQFSQFYFDKNILQNNSIIFQTVKELKINVQLQSSLLEYKFDKIKIVNSNCYTINCFMIMSTPINTYSITSNLTISNFQISNIGLFSISQQNTLLTTSALISWNNFQDIKLSNLQFDNIQGLTIFYISILKSLTITTLKYDWSQSNYYQQKINPKNNLIPTSIDCSVRKITRPSFSYILFFIDQFSSAINISDILIQRQLLIDASIFHIQSYDIAYINTTKGNITESIILERFQILNNSLVSTNRGFFSGCINIISNQIQTIIMNNLNFQSNHLQQIISKQTIPIATLFQISSSKSTIRLTQLLSEYNRAIKSDFGLIKINCQKIIISNATFRYTNIVDKLWVKRIEPNQIITDNDLKSFFEIKSYGAIMNLKTIEATISQLFINYTSGIQAGIKLQTIGTSNILIKDSQLFNIFSSLELKHSSIGGSLYIDSTLSNLNCIISNISIINSRVRQTGGCIYILASNLNQNITIVKSNFQECQALETSFMKVDFLADAIFQQVTLQNVNIQDNSIDKLISVVPQIQIFEQLFFLKTSSVYTQNNGRLIIGDTQFNQINYTSALSLSQIKFLYINKLQILKGYLFYNPLISLSFLQSGGQAYIGNLEIIQFNETDSQMNSSNCPSEFPQSFTYIIPEQNCDSILQIQEQLDEIDNQDEIYEYYDEILENQYQGLNSNSKYIPINIQKAKLDNQSQIIDIMITLNQQLVSCLINSILILSQKLNLDKFTSLFYVNEVNDNSLIKIKKMQFVKNQCLQCRGGLLQVRSISHSNLKELIFISEFFCQYSIVGYYGCASLLVDEKINDVTLLSKIIDNDIKGSRLLQSSDIRSLNYTIFISNYQCINNLARAGTCLNLRGVTVIIQDSLFSINNATLVGGSIYFDNLGSNNMYLQNNQFINNYAQIGGAIYLLNYQLSNTENQQINFDKNYADDGGNDIQELTIQQTLQLINIPFETQTYLDFDGDESDDGAIDNSSAIIKDNITLEYHKIGNYPEQTNLLILPSGQKISKYLYFYEVTQEQVPFEWVFRIINLNRFGDVIKNGISNESCTIDGRIQNSSSYDVQKSFSNNFTIPSKVYYNQEKGGFDMDDLILIFDPLSSDSLYLELRFICNSVALPIYNPKPPYQIVGYNRNYELYARVRTFPCQIGEAYDSQQCKACQKSDMAYSVKLGSVMCKQMNRLTMKTVTPTGINLIQGYWRPIYQNDQIEYCVNLPNNCNGGWIPGNPSCYTGHVGALCESCDIYMIQTEERWAPSDPYKCGLCKDSEKFNLIIIIAISILTMISTIMSVKGTFEALQLQIVEKATIMIGVRLQQHSSNLATIVQTLTNYFQIVQIVMTFQLQIPSGVQTATQTAGNPTGSMAYSLDCLLIKITEIELLYFKMIWALIMPLSYLGAIIFGYLIICIIGITKFSQSIIYTALIYMFLYMHPTLVQGFISQASIRTISGLQWVKADVAYRYDSDLHNYWMARFIGPMLILWVILLPGLFMFMVWRKRNKLELMQTKMTLGYFYREYSKDSYLWEFVKIFQKEFFVIILVYYEEYVIIKGLLIVLVLFIYGWYQVSVNPYSSKTLNQTDRYSTMVCAATLCLGVLMYGAQIKDYFYLQVIILIILAFLNLWFIIMCILQIFQGYLIKFQDQLDLIREKLLKSKPELSKKRGFLGKLLIHRGNMQKRVKYLWSLLKSRTLAAVQITKLSEEISFEDALEYVIQNEIDQTHILKTSQKKHFEILNSQENE
ncbi:unnamed protein product [Paramecium sonneborni]|uniref:Transmembrane protein n=1 Tax=Paramecium sonneborni TaxID=65129 RepID=A0A8S1LVD5_9CILI|nr:unnamed protein product [Paramecium sonneborni]